MLPITDDYRMLDSLALLPEIAVQHGGGAYVFNPTICAIPGGYAICYRVVLPNSDERRLATCRLDANLVPVPGSVVALSDLITFSQPDGLDHRALTWHADPRYFVLGGRIYLSWNDGSAQPQNHQFLIEMDATGTRPAGPAREIVTSRERRPVEKNWMFFEAEGKVWCIYSSMPLDVMAVDMDDPARIHCTPAFSALSNSDYESLYGIVRGGAQPVRRGETFLVLAHSSYKMTNGLRYYACMVYEMQARPPFAMTRCGSIPFTLPRPEETAGFSLAKLNPSVGGVVYPCGIEIAGDTALIAYGINDERAAVARLPVAALEATLERVKERKSARLAGLIPDPAAATVNTAHTPRLFWWDAVDKSFDGNHGKRKFGIGNFGDIAARDIVEKVGGLTTRRWVADGIKLLAVGSIMHNARNGDVIWGSGVKGTQRALHESVQHLDVRACRGPLSADVLRAHRIDMSKMTHVFDPGVLVARLWAAEIAAYDPARNAARGRIRIIPHYKDDIFFRRMYPQHIASFISVDDTPLGMIEKMLGAEAVFSSSLHGIIFAESLGIPAYWLAPHGGEDVMKYFDYYYGTGRYNIHAYDSLHEAIKAPALPLPHFEIDAYLATFPHDRMADLSDNGIALASEHSLGAMTRTDIGEIASVTWEDLRLTGEGLIVMKAATEMRLLVGREVRENAYLSLTLGRTRGGLASPLRIEVKVMGDVVATLAWSARESDEQVCEICLPRGFGGRYVDVALRCIDGRNAQVVLRKIALRPAGAAIWSDRTSRSERQRETETLADRVAALFVEHDREWLINLRDLAETAQIRKDLRKDYVRLLPKAELAVPRNILGRSRLIFLTGPSFSSERALDGMTCFVDGKRAAVSVVRNGSDKSWSAKCDMKDLVAAGPGLARVRFDFAGRGETGAAGALPEDSVLVRKIALAKA